MDLHELYFSAQGVLALIISCILMLLLWYHFHFRFAYFRVSSMPTCGSSAISHAFCHIYFLISRIFLWCWYNTRCTLFIIPIASGHLPFHMPRDGLPIAIRQAATASLATATTNSLNIWWLFIGILLTPRISIWVMPLASCFDAVNIFDAMIEYWLLSRLLRADCRRLYRPPVLLRP